MIVLNHQTSLSSRTGCNPQQTGRLLLEGLAGCTSDLVTRAYFLTSRSVSHCSEFFFQCWIESARCQPLTSCCPPPADMEASRLGLRGTYGSGNYSSSARCNGMFCMQSSVQPSIVSLSRHILISTAEHPTLFCNPHISQIAISNAPLCCFWVITNSVHAYFGLSVSQVVPKLARPTYQKYYKQ